MLGGMSWESTALYYRTANELVRDREGGLASADLLVRSVDFSAIRRMQLEDRWDDAAELLLREGKALEAAGAELVILCTNYMHKVAPTLEAGLGVPFLHIADVVAEAAKAQGARASGSPAWLRPWPSRSTASGSAGTASRWSSRTQRTASCSTAPSSTSSARACCPTDAYGAARGAGPARGRRAQAIVLGCTELELLLMPEDCAVPLLPTARLHVQAAIDAAFAA
jgi:aspartate racemase